jgi:hypothetical protein
MNLDLHLRVGYFVPMRRGIAAAALIVFATTAAGPRDALSRAKQLYNGAQYDAAIDVAATAAKTPDFAAAAQLVIARAYLERFRRGGNADDKTAARNAIKQVRLTDLSDDDRVELLIALGESLYFDGQAGAAAEQFDLALSRAGRKQSTRRERLLDWWATALDLDAQSSADAVARPLQARIVRRMEEELHDNMSATTASYWLAAAARSSGDIERAWAAAIAGWVRISQLGSQGADTRRELDALVMRAIIPDRARQVSPPSPEAAAATMRSQWEALKKAWS